MGADPVARTIQSYDQIAPQYAEIWFDDPVMEPLLEEFASLTAPKGQVLDAGCGSGRDLLALSRYGFSVVGIDLSDRMAQEARRRAPNSTVHRMDFRRLLFPRETFDGIWCCACLQHLPLIDAELTLREFARVLKSDGTLAISSAAGTGARFDSLNRFQRSQSLDEFESLLINSGFEIESIKVSEASKSTDNGSRPRQWIQGIARVSQRRRTNLHADDHNCAFCPQRRFRANRQLGLPGAGSVLWADDDFYWMVDVAPITIGHSLLISQSHASCFGALPRKQIENAMLIQESIRQRLAESFGSRVLFFEHGACRPGNAGACIAHAHLHCVPSPPTMDAAPLDELLGRPSAAALSDLPAIYEAGDSYLYIESSNARGNVYKADILPSQIVRSLIAGLRRPEHRWQSRCRLEDNRQNFIASIERLSELIRDHPTIS